MGKILFLFCGLFLVTAARAEFRHHGAHVHGAAQLSIAFDGTQGEIDYDGAAINIFGFEHKAVSAKDKKAQTEGLQKLRDHMGDMLKFDPSLACKIIEAKTFMEQDGNHSDVNGRFKIGCAKSPAGSRVGVDFSKYFATLKKLHIQFLADNIQKSIDVEHFPMEFEVK